MRIFLSQRRVALAALAGMLAFALASHAEEPATPMIVKIHADWCGTCSALETTFEALEPQVGGDARIVILDVTDREAVARSQAEADRLGIRAFFDAYKSKTGTVGVLDANGTAVTVMKGEMDPAKYVAAVKKAAGEPAS